MIEHFEVGEADDVGAGMVKRIATELRLTDEQATALQRGLKFRAELFNAKHKNEKDPAERADQEDKGRGDTEAKGKIISICGALLSASVALEDLEISLRERLYEGYRIAAAELAVDIDRQQAQDHYRADLLALKRLTEAASIAVRLSPEDQTGPQEAKKTEAASIVIELLSTVLDRSVIFGKATRAEPTRDFRACRQLMSHLMPDMVLEDCDVPLRTAFLKRPRRLQERELN